MQLNIQDPCQENWEKMTTNDLGKYCSKCEKNVIDFTGMTDKEIFLLMSKKEGKICGRIMHSQLQRPIYNRDIHAVPNNLSKVAAGIALLTSLNAASQQEEEQDSLQIEQALVDSTLVAETPSDSLTVNDSIVDLTKTVELDTPDIKVWSEPMTIDVNVMEVFMGDVVWMGCIAPDPDPAFRILNEYPFVEVFETTTVSDTIIESSDDTHIDYSDPVESMDNTSVEIGVKRDEEPAEEENHGERPRISSLYLHELTEEEKRNRRKES